MVMKYVILADISVDFETPRQLTKINDEPLIARTIRLLKENNVEDILVTSHDKKFDNLGAIRYEAKYNYYIPNYDDYKKTKGYWLNAFPIELLNQPICFLFGDVYYSEEAIKTITTTKTDSTLFFCSYENNSKYYIKHHDEPLAYKVVDYKLFKKHINKVKKMKDKGLCCREPIVWELYRSINNQDINIHEMTQNYVVINDISCDIDKIDDIEKLKDAIRRQNMIKCEVIKKFGFSRFNELKNIKRKSIEVKDTLLVGDTFECSKEIADYLLGDNPIKEVVVKVIEVIPEVEVKKEKVVKPTKKKKK